MREQVAGVAYLFLGHDWQAAESGATGGVQALEKTDDSHWDGGEEYVDAFAGR
ncbi:hypothetical protein [Streptomyces sp. NPDC002580]|uniref:hypothetical protein n=1 Tax=Streptomyces sp. NPDC002580 TaxID=3364653 RepID=UPI0036B9C14E